MPEITIDLTNFLKLPWFGKVFVLLLDILGIIMGAVLIAWILIHLFHWEI